MITMANPTRTSLNTPVPQRRLPRYGFHTHTELFNGRLAMLGFVIAVATEALSGKGILGQLGLG